jgi:GNAT superfamily N-acetyltransferase
MRVGVPWGIVAPPGPPVNRPPRKGGATAAWEYRIVLTLRPMTADDVPAAVEAFDTGFLAMRARFGLPVTGSSLQDERRRQVRTRHFLDTDPAGSWVADDEGTIVGMSQSFVREDYWMLSQLGTVPGVQGRGVGRELLRLALSYGDPASPGTIQCSRDPKAMALYTSFGFSLHLRPPRPTRLFRYAGRARQRRPDGASLPLAGRTASARSHRTPR